MTSIPARPQPKMLVVSVVVAFVVGFIASTQQLSASDETEKFILEALEKNAQFFNSKGRPSDLGGRVSNEMAEKADKIKIDIQNALIGLPLDLECDLRGSVKTDRSERSVTLFSSLLFNPRLHQPSGPLVAHGPELVGDSVYGLICAPFSLPTIAVVIPIAVGADPRLMENYRKNSLFAQHIGDWISGYEMAIANKRPFKLQINGVDLYEGDVVRIKSKIQMAELYSLSAYFRDPMRSVINPELLPFVLNLAASGDYTYSVEKK